MKYTYSCEHISFQLLAQTQTGKLLRRGTLRAHKHFISASKEFHDD